VLTEAKVKNELGLYHFVEDAKFISEGKDKIYKTIREAYFSNQDVGLTIFHKGFFYITQWIRGRWSES
jgi:hypothetical protein